MDGCSYIKTLVSLADNSCNLLRYLKNLLSSPPSPSLYKSALHVFKINYMNTFL
jgi:hypothetical protein